MSPEKDHPEHIDEGGWGSTKAVDEIPGFSPEELEAARQQAAEKERHEQGQ